MKTCPNCNVQLDDAATFCANCGARIPESAQAQPQYTQNTAVPPQGDPYDHTAEFDPQDISDNKVFAMLGYLLGTVGIIIALLASRKSPFTHVPCQTGTQIHGCQHSHAYMRSASFLDDNRSCCIRRYELYISCSQSYLLLPDLLGQSQRACDNPQPRLP